MRGDVYVLPLSFSIHSSCLIEYSDSFTFITRLPTGNENVQILRGRLIDRICEVCRTSGFMPCSQGQPLGPILRQLNPVHSLTPYYVRSFLILYSLLIFPFVPRLKYSCMGPTCCILMYGEEYRLILWVVTLCQVQTVILRVVTLSGTDWSYELSRYVRYRLWSCGLSRCIRYRLILRVVTLSGTDCDLMGCHAMSGTDCDLMGCQAMSGTDCDLTGYHALSGIEWSYRLSRHVRYRLWSYGLSRHVRYRLWSYGLSRHVTYRQWSYGLSRCQVQTVILRVVTPC